MKAFKLLALFSLVMALLLSGCASTGEDVGANAEGGMAQGEEQTTGAQVSGMDGGGQWTGSPLDDPNSPLYEKVIYFDFDESFIRQEYVDMLRAHAEYLVNHPQAHVIIEGHCDERGSREYNMALGERRANAVKRFLEAEGVSPVQLETVSYGEERPADPGHNEAAWAKNRRAVLVY